MSRPNASDFIKEAQVGGAVYSILIGKHTLALVLALLYYPLARRVRGYTAYIVNLGHGSFHGSGPNLVFYIALALVCEGKVRKFLFVSLAAYSNPHRVSRTDGGLLRLAVFPELSYDTPVPTL